jgi:4-amino-4-deoxy-L-arabinose transferase-like glycosyltransferase
MPLLVAAVALAVRASFLLGIEAYPKFELIRNQLDDQVFFHTWAVAMVRETALDLAATGHEFAYWAQGRPGVYPQDPLYAWALAALYRAAGFRFEAVRWTQALLGSLAAALTCGLALRLVSAPAALLTGLFVALFGPMVFYEAAFLREAPAAALCVGVLWLLDTAVRPYDKPHRRAAWLLAAAGLLLGAGVLLRSNLLLFALAAIAWAAWAARRRTLALALAAGVALPVLPVVAVNTARSGRLALVSSSGAYNFFIGNAHEATGDGRRVSRLDDRLEASGPPGSVSLYRAALRDIAEHPLGFLRLQVRKAALFFSAADMPDNLSVPMGAKTNPRLALAPVGLHVLLPLALSGAVLGLREWGRLSLLYLFLASYTLSIVAFFVVSRLQLPAVPVLALFAGLALDAWLRAWRRRWLVRAGATAMAVAAAAAALRPPDDLYRPVDLQMAAAAYATRGAAEEAAGRLDAARRFYGRAAALNPDHEGVLARLSSLAAGSNAPPPRPEAAALCEEARLAATAGRYDDARARLREAARLEPRWALPHRYLANVAFLQGDRRQALAHLERAVEKEPLDPALRAGLKQLRGAVDQGSRRDVNESK